MSIVKQVLVLAVLAAAAAGLYALGKPWIEATSGGSTPASAQRAGGGPGPVAVETMRATSRPLAVKLEAVGTTRARFSVEIVPLASGRIEALAFEAGQTVRQGDVLVRLDDDIQRADVTEAEAKKTQAGQAFERAKTLTRDNISTRATLEQLEAAAASAGAELDRAKRRLADREIRAPFAGVTGLRQVDVGARVDDSTVITRLDDVSEVELEFTLPEAAFGETRRGQPVTATAAAFPGRTFTGAVSAIDNRVDPVARAFRVRAVLPNPDQALPAGMFMLISLLMAERNGIVVPEEAVVLRGEQASVFVVNGGKTEARTVRIGLREPGLVEIVEGVKEGEEVVVRGLQRVRDGTPVDAKPLSAPATARSGTAG
jgi:membrane fusion protein (multidrug efflux system)